MSSGPQRHENHRTAGHHLEHHVDGDMDRPMKVQLGFLGGPFRHWQLLHANGQAQIGNQANHRDSILLELHHIVALKGVHRQLARL